MPGGMPTASPFGKKPEPVWLLFLLMFVALIVDEARGWRCRLLDHDTWQASNRVVVCRRCGKRWP